MLNDYSKRRKVSWRSHHSQLVQPSGPLERWIMLLQNQTSVGAHFDFNSIKLQDLHLGRQCGLEVQGGEVI